MNQLPLNNKYTPQFPDLDSLFALEGEQVTTAKRRHVIKTTIDKQTYYVKRYMRPGTGLRRFLGRSRLRAEWENLRYFASQSIPVPDMVAYGEQRKGFFKKGALLLREIPDVVPLNEIAQHEIFQDKQWRHDVIQKIASYVRILHQHRFVHGDLYLRNILVNMQSDVYFIDCPQGKKRFWPILRHWVIKDLACLYKEAKGLFSEEECLYFLQEYTGHLALTAKDKRIIDKVVKRNCQSLSASEGSSEL